MTTRAELDAIIATRQAALQRARGGATDVAERVTPSANPPAFAHSTPPKNLLVETLTSEPWRPQPVPPPARAALRNPRPPPHYLAGEPEPWRDHVGPDGLIAPGAGRGPWWGPI
jgi:hypothetical protein